MARRGESRPVLLVSGPGGDARRYRCDHRRAQLVCAGVAADVCYRDDVILVPLARRYRCIVLYRVRWDEGVGHLLEEARRHGCTVVCDFDDLVFEPGQIALLRALAALDDGERKAYVEGIALQRQTLVACGGTSVATEPLGAAAAEVVARVSVVYNSVSAEMVRLRTPHSPSGEIATTVSASVTSAARRRTTRTFSKHPMLCFGHSSRTPTSDS